MMTKDSWAIIGTMVTIGTIMSTRFDDLRREMNTRFDEVNRRFTDLDGDIDNLRTDVRQMDERLRNVEIEFGKVD